MSRRVNSRPTPVPVPNPITGAVKPPPTPKEVLPEITEEVASILYDIVKQEASLKAQREIAVRTIHASLGVDSSKYTIEHDGKKLAFVPIPVPKKEG